MYHKIKNKLASTILNCQKELVRFNTGMNSRKEINDIVHTYNPPKLNYSEIKSAKLYYKSKGLKLENTNWHRYIKSRNGKFHNDYIPDDIFRSIIDPKLNQKKQWPALLDKNLTYTLFSGFNQPKHIVQNINGFFYINGKLENVEMAIDVCLEKKSFLIKPTIDTGKGRMVKVYNINSRDKDVESLKLSKLFRAYKKDFILQEVVEQSDVLKILNSSSLNTLRIMSYMNDNGVHIISAVLRIGSPDSEIDNYSAGGIVCGVNDNGQLKSNGYSSNGEVFSQTPSGITLGDYQLPNYHKVLNMIKDMHPIVPYFKIVSWDIGIDKNDEPIFIEYNTYNQSTYFHQIVNGPLLGKFTDEILELALKRA